MSEFVFQEVLEATGATRSAGDPRRVVRGVSTDTRSLRPGELYVALSGPRFDGNAFAAEALARGAAGLVLRREPEGAAPPLPSAGDVPVAWVEDPRRALGDLARAHRDRLAIPVIGVTGSCGKTTTKNMLVELLADHLDVTGSPASFNNDVGVPSTVLSAPLSCGALVVEMGTNAPGEIAALARIARPTAGIVTNVGASHLEGLGSVEGVAHEKGALAAAVPSDGFVVLNADCRWTSLVRELSDARVITFSIDGGGDLDARSVWFHAGGTTFDLAEAGRAERQVTLPLLGLHTVQNLLAALAACRGLGFELDDVLPAVARLRDGRRRMERVEVGGITLLDDSYNANPESARASVRVLAGWHGHARRVLVLGDMCELGAHAEAQHREVGRFAAEARLDLVVLVGDEVRHSARAALEAGLAARAVVRFPDARAAGAGVPELLAEGDVVLVKGSRAMGMERVAAAIQERFGARSSASPRAAQLA